MRGIKKRGGGKWKKRAIFIVLLVLFAVLLNSVFKVYKKKQEAEKALAQSGAELAELQNREEFLEDSLRSLDTQEGLEFEIRRRLNVAGAGEGVAIIVEESQSASSTVPEKSFWQKTKDFFTELFE